MANAVSSSVVRSISAAVALGVCVGLSGVASADLVGPEDRACLRLKEGDVCDERLEFRGGPGYRGVCARVDFGEGRSRLRCALPDLVLTEREEGCRWEREGGECRYGGAGIEGVCVVSRSIKADVWGGAGKMDLPIFKCVRAPKDRAAEERAGALLLGGPVGAAVLFAVGLWWWRRRQRGRGKVEDPG